MRLNRCATLLCAPALFWSAPAPASLLSMTPTVQTITLAPGSAWDAMGTITNLSGFDLLSSEIFLEFSAYPHTVLAPQQRLGGIEFTIGDRTVSGLAELFHVDIAPDAVRGLAWSMDVFAADVHGNFSDPTTFSFLIDGPAVVVPEPSTLPLLAAGLAALLAGAGLARQRALHPDSAGD
ncbi:PEP-CTERM sorting domain-containing protein [Massilia antarctica]|uniref:PEP-CTERM sorting domain-containing protein n=1 Tax=Massilia antarctica TaxID=2765360 RepID=A0AA48WBK5_9BURK|nr:PEP-CTERM sorting domain-containing protein [Massilia antarctica]QPI49571.1 PEP-CTERM sorting domain-containing protein [Massilia antarctica]